MSLPLNHLHLHVADVDRSVAFYEEQLGMTVSQRFGDLVFLGDGRGFDLALAPDEEGTPMPGWFHFGSHLPTVADVRAAFARMEAAGVIIKRPLEDHGDYVTFTAADPDGHGIEVYCDPSLRGTSQRDG